MKKTNRLLAVLLSLVLLCSALPFAFAENATIVDSGTSGKLTWTLDSENSLTISGTGSINNYSTTKEYGTICTSAPWGKYFQTIEAVMLDDSVTSIGSSAFYGCTALESVTIPDSVTSIGERAFYNCTALTSVTIPDSVTSIGYRAFSRDLPTSNGEYYLPTATLLCNKDSYVASWAESTNAPYIINGSTDADNIISETVNAKLSYSIDKRTRTLNVFNQGKLISFSSYNAPWRQYQQYVETAILSDGCTSVSEQAFYQCYNLKRVVLPETVETIDANAFQSCVSLQEITIPDAVTSIGYSAFQNCASLQTATIGNSVTSISNYAFQNCSSLQNLVLPEGLQSIGEYAFNSCSSLQSIVIPDSVTSMGYDAFRYCYALQSVVIGDGLTSIPYDAFYNCTALETVSIGENVTRIYEYAFSNCSKLSTVLFGEKVQDIDTNAFGGCSSLPAVDLPASVSYIGPRAFSDSALKDITIRNKECSINKDAISIYATIHGHEGSSAAKFADTYGYYFVPLEAHEHVFGDWQPLPKDYYSCEQSYERFCTACGLRETKTEDAHSYYEYSRTGSCAEGGTITYRCNRCGKEKTEELPATGHDYDRYIKGICTETHDVVYRCKNCGEQYTEKQDATDHTFGEPKVDERCGGRIEFYYCSVCGYSYEKVVTEPNHDYVEVDRLEPYCGNKGYVVYECGNCGDKKTEGLLPVSEHDYVVEKVYNCYDTEHDILWRCSVCNETLRRKDPHRFGDWIVEREATCGQNGYQYRVCKDCGWIEKQWPPATGEHHFVFSHYEKWSDEEHGVTSYCSECGLYSNTPEAHTYGDWAEGKKPTCTEKGYDYRVCEVCGWQSTRTVPTTGHAFGAWSRFVMAEDAAYEVEIRFCNTCGYYELRQADPANQTDPTEPTNPTEPTDPTNPTSQTDPTDPTNPTDPTSPTDPTDPTEPVTEPTTEPTDENGGKDEAPKGFFAKIAAFFRNLFARLFGGRNR